MVSAGGGERPLRLFLACDLPPEALSVVQHWQATWLRPHTDVRVVGSLHITLAFLGDLPEATVDDIAAALRPVGFAAFQAGFEGPLFLPERGAKHVVALRLSDPSGELARLQVMASDALRTTGLYKASRRPWLGHVTVARFRRPGHPFPLQNVTIQPFGVDRMVLYSSLLDRGGAVHTPLAAFTAS
jgi:RNA 2',3'-cyclic 3'-phosphodiesterase